MEKRLEMMTKWLKDSGLTVNEAKTEVCLFYARDHPVINLRVNGIQVRSKKSMNVLGVKFDSKLQWNIQVAKTIMKARRASRAIKLIKRNFNVVELRNLLTSNYFSILYYNCEI